MATRKISDLTLLTSGNVSSSDTLLLLDNSDPTDQNKRTAIGSIFKAVPSGTYTSPGVQFEGKTSTGVFSTTQGQVGLAMGDARLNLQKVGTTLNIQARDSADTNLDFTISAQGTGKIRLGSILAINDLNFIIPNSSDETKVARFSTASIPAGVQHTYVLPSNGAAAASDTIVTLTATQTLSNKTIASPIFTGAVTVSDISIGGNTTIGDESSDSLTVNAASIFASSTTFNNTFIVNQGATVTGDVGVTGKVVASTGFEPATDLGTDLGSNAKSFANAFVGALGIGDTNGDSIVNLGTANPNLILKSTNGEVQLNRQGVVHLATTATGITIGGAIDAVTSITSTGNIAVATDKFTLDSTNGNAVFGGNITGGGNITATSGTNFEFGSVNGGATNVGIGRTASSYNLEVEGTIYATGSTIIAGNGSAGKFILQKGAAGIGLHFTDNTGTDQAVLDSGGNFGIGKSPSNKFDVSGNSNIDGDLSITTTNPAAGTGGKITAREIILTDPVTSTTSTLNAQTSGGVSRARVYFQSFN